MEKRYLIKYKIYENNSYRARYKEYNVIRTIDLDNIKRINKLHNEVHREALRVGERIVLDTFIEME